MNNIIKIIILLLITLIPYTVSASSIISTNCIKDKEYYKCDIYANTNYEISSIDFKYNIPSDMTLIKFPINNKIWNGATDNNWVTLYSLKDSKGKVLLGTMYINSDNSPDKLIEFQDIKVYDSNYEEKIEYLILEEKQTVNNKKHEYNKYIFYLIFSILIVGIILLIIRKGAKK